MQERLHNQGFEISVPDLILFLRFCHESNDNLAYMGLLPKIMFDPIDNTRFAVTV
jgi:hypothetical protein